MKPPKAKRKILTPPRRTHSCSSSCSGRGASRVWGFSGPLHHQSVTGPLARLCARAALPPRSSFPFFPNSWRSAEPSCPNPPTPPRFFLCRAVPGQEGRVGPGARCQGRALRAAVAGRGPSCQDGGGGAPGHFVARRPHRAPSRLPGLGTRGKGLCVDTDSLGWVAAALAPVYELLPDPLILAPLLVPINIMLSLVLHLWLP